MNKERYSPQIGGVKVSPQNGDTRDDAIGSESILKGHGRQKHKNKLVKKLKSTLY